MQKFHFLALLVSISGLLALSACNTMEGVGKDIQKAGERIEDAAD